MIIIMIIVIIISFIIIIIVMVITFEGGALKNRLDAPRSRGVDPKSHNPLYYDLLYSRDHLCGPLTMLPEDKNRSQTK